MLGEQPEEQLRGGVSARIEDDVLDLTMADDGVGGADLAHGSGLIGLGDRVEVIGRRQATRHQPTGGAGTMDAARQTAKGRIVLADDDALLREGLASLCERLGYEAAGQAGDAVRLLELDGDERPDLAVVDVRMPPDHATEGLKAARTTRERHPGTGILLNAGIGRRLKVTEDAVEKYVRGVLG